METPSLPLTSASSSASIGWGAAIAALHTMNTSNGYVVGRHNMRCRITAISEVDVPAMKEAERIALAAPKA